MTRNNEFILKVMDVLKNNIEEMEAGDTVDGPIYHRQTNACCEEKYLRKAVLYATSEDDPETLEALKDWAFDHGKVERTEKLNCYCPIIVACIEVKFIVLSQCHISPYPSSSEVFQMHSNSVCHEL